MPLSATNDFFAFQKEVVIKRVKQRQEELRLCLKHWDKIDIENPKAVEFYFKLFLCCYQQVAGYEENYVIQGDKIDFDKPLTTIHNTELIIDQHGKGVIVPWSSRSSQIPLISRNNKPMRIIRQDVDPLIDKSKQIDNSYYYHIEEYSNVVCSMIPPKYFLENDCCLDELEIGGTNLKAHIHVPTHAFQNDPSSPQQLIRDLILSEEKEGDVAGTSSDQSDHVLSAELEDEPGADDHDIVECINKSDDNTKSNEDGDFAESADLNGDEKNPQDGGADQVVSSLKFEAIGWKREKGTYERDVSNVNERMISLTVGETQKSVNEGNKTEEVEERTSVSCDPSTSTRSSKSTQQMRIVENVYPTQSRTTGSKVRIIEEVPGSRLSTRSMIPSIRVFEYVPQQRMGAERVKRVEEVTEESRVKIKNSVKQFVDEVLLEIHSSNWNDFRKRLVWEDYKSENAQWFDQWKTSRIFDRNQEIMRDNLTTHVCNVASSVSYMLGLRNFCLYTIDHSTTEGFAGKRNSIIEWSYYGFFGDGNIGKENVTTLPFKDEVSEFVSRLVSPSEDLASSAYGALSTLIDHFTKNPAKILDLDIAWMLRRMQQWFFIPEISKDFISNSIDLKKIPSLEERVVEDAYIAEFVTYLNGLFQ